MTLRDIWLRLAHVYVAQAKKLYDSIMIACLNDPNGAAGTRLEKAESLARQNPEMHELYRKAGIYHRLLADAGSSMSCWWMADLLGRHAETLADIRRACEWIGRYKKICRTGEMESLNFWCLGHINQVGISMANGGNLSSGTEVFRLIAELGYPSGMVNYAKTLCSAKKFSRARSWLDSLGDSIDGELRSRIMSTITQAEQIVRR